MLKKLCCIFMLVVLVACQQADINVEQGSYIYKGDDISVLATLELKENDDETCFELSPATISSTMYRGDYKVDGHRLILHDDEKDIDIYFTIYQKKLLFYGSSKDKVDYLDENSQFIFVE